MKYIVFTFLLSGFFLSLSAQTANERVFTTTTEGISLEMFDTDGNLVESGQFTKDGLHNGKWTAYYTDGSIKTVAFYNEGEKVGNWMHFDRSKNLVHQVSYNNSQMIAYEGTLMQTIEE